LKILVVSLGEKDVKYVDGIVMFIRGMLCLLEECYVI
jgi:hypothetical protein